MRLALAIAGLVALAAAACATNGAALGPAAAVPSPTAAPTPLDWPAAEPTESAMPAHVRLLRGFAIPLRGADVPQGEAYLPNSPREYRAGYHEGIDFPVPVGTPVLAAKAGTVVRADTAFRDWTPAEEHAAFAEAIALGHTPAATLDRIRGRQVWIDHGEGIVTRYAHLSTVAGLRPGDHVDAGQVIGAVGSSGYPEGGPHLHFEIRVGDDFYGDGLPAPQLRYAIATAFR